MTLDHTIAGLVRVVLLAHIADCRICGISIEHLTTLVCHSLTAVDLALCNIKRRIDIGCALTIQTHTRDNGVHDLFLCLHHRQGFHAIQMQLIAQAAQFHALADLCCNGVGTVMVQLVAGIIRVVELYFNDRKHHVRGTTMDTKRNIFDTKIVPLLGNRKMNEITALDIRDWQQRVKEMGEATGLPYAETYLYTIHAQLTALFNYAQTFYGLQFNPCDAAGYMGSSIAGEMLIITKDQYEILRKEFRNEAYLLAFDILFWTGCREGEMLALLPKDLTDDDQLRIYKTYHRKKGQDILGPTKNSKKGGNRNVPIPHWLAEEFRTYCSKLYGLTPDDRVFYMTCTALNKELTRCTQITYLPDIRVHDLRHSHVSLCIELGYSIVLVAKRIGDTVPVVMRTYAHLYPNKQQELVSRLETLSTSSSSKDESDLMPLV